jgi:hypothetical protein
MKLNLKEITVCAVDSINPSLAIRAINECLKDISFGDAILFSDADVDTKQIQQIKIKKIESKNEYSKFLLKEIAQHISTSHALIVQWDGYVVDPQSWQVNFLNYDYIGAEWFWHKDGMNVGNGGFSLRSKKLLDALCSDEFPFIENVNEDEQICRIYREKLVNNFNIKFAPTEIANEFAYERSTPKKSTFGFHGIFNMWRHLDDKEVIDLVNQLHSSTISSIEYYELVVTYYSMNKFAITKALYSNLRKYYTIEEIAKKFINVVNDLEQCKNLIINCEILISQKY